MRDEWTEVPRKTGKPAISAVLVFAGSLVLAALIISVWANRQALNTDIWVSTSEKVLQDSEVQSELSRYITDELFFYIDVEGDQRDELPTQLQDLEDTSASGLRRQTPVEVKKALNTKQFEQIWSEVNRIAHEALLRALEGRGGGVSTEDNKVILDLNPVLTKMSRQLGFADEDTARIPSEAARLTILEAHEISTARDVESLMRIAPFVLTFLAVILFGIAIWVAGTSRRYVVCGIGVGFVVAGVLALTIRGAASPSAVDLLTSDESVRPAVDAAWRVGTSLLATISIWTIVLGVLIFVGGLLAGLRPSDRRTPDRFQHYPDV
ncbi:MAG: hypothetical protein ACSLFI_00905 [Solirubrobacterales bacterium]